MSGWAYRLAIVLPVVLLVALWWILVPEGSKAAFLLGSPPEIGRAAVTIVRDPVFWADLRASVSILVVGYVLGVVLGFTAGLSGWVMGRFGRVFEVYFVALGSIPLFAIAPLLIFAFGIGSGTRIVIVTLSVLIPVALTSVSAARDIERRYEDVLRSFATTRGRTLRLIVAPGTLFACLPALKPAANAALVAIFLSEWISAERGLAKFVLASMSTYKVPDMWVGLFTFVALGVAFGSGVNLLERRITRWRLS